MASYFYYKHKNNFKFYDFFNQMQIRLIVRLCATKKATILECYCFTQRPAIIGLLIRHEYTNPCCRLQITKATQIERRAGKRPPCRLRWLEDLLWRPRGVSGGLNLPPPNSAPGSSNKYQKAFVDGPQKGHRIHVYDVNIFPPLPPSQ